MWWILTDPVRRYLLDLEPERTGVVKELEQAAQQRGMPSVPWITARFLATLVRTLDPVRVLEIGTGFGYATLHMAQALGRGRIVTLEYNPERASQAREFFDRAGVGERVEIVEGDAFTTIERLEGPFDMVLIDGSRTVSRRFLELAEPKLTANAVALIPGTMIWGQVARDYEADAFWRSEIEVLLVSMARATNAELVSSDRWQGVVLPIGDGIGFAARR